MAAAPVTMLAPPVAYSKRPPLMLSPRRREANRRNAARSTGPRTARGKARVARNAVKHGFFAGPQQWTPGQYRDFIETFDGLRADLRPQTVREDRCVRTIAGSAVRMAAMLRYENIAALKYHQRCERELEERIAAATPFEAANLRARREELRQAGLWAPTIPGPRDAAVIIRYEGRLNRAIRGATASLYGLQAMRVAPNQKVQKQTHFLQENRDVFGIREVVEGRGRASMTAPLRAPAQSRGSRDLEGVAIAKMQKQTATPSSSVLSAPRRTSDATQATSESAKTNRCETTSSSVLSASRRTSDAVQAISGSAKTNPLNPAFTGNRHERRRAKALARQHRPNT